MNLLGIPLVELTQILQTVYGKGLYHAKAIFREVQRYGNPQFYRALEFADNPRFAARLAHDFSVNIDPVTARYREGKLVKFVTTLGDGHRIESVIVPAATRRTLCISTQVGCKRGCRFCTTGKMGFHRNLDAGEMIGQFHNARFAFGESIRNVVFMGMGEPLDNFEQVAKTVAILTDPRGVGLAKRHITVSTVGPAQGLARLIAWNQPGINLAVSLNAPNNRIRSFLMPVNYRLPMNPLRDMLKKIPLGGKGRVLIEYILFKNLNSTEAHARELVDYLEPLKVKVNLIPYNASAGDFLGEPKQSDILRFRDVLMQLGVLTHIRIPKGRRLKAACGQLGFDDKHPSGTHGRTVAGEPTTG